jgi:hypothetical protein
MCVYIDKSLRIGKDVASGATGNIFLLVSAVALPVSVLIRSQLGLQCQARSLDDAKVLRQSKRLRVYSNFSRMSIVLFMDDGWQPNVTS